MVIAIDNRCSGKSGQRGEKIGLTEVKRLGLLPTMLTIVGTKEFPTGRFGRRLLKKRLG